MPTWYKGFQYIVWLAPAKYSEYVTPMGVGDDAKVQRISEQTKKR